VQTPCRNRYSAGNVNEKGNTTLRALLGSGHGTDWAKEEFLEGDGYIQGMFPFFARLDHSDCMTGPTQPDITFFHEPVPRVFHTQMAKDIPLADLLIVIGTSLLIPPVKDIPGTFNICRFSRDESADLNNRDRSSSWSTEYCH
jgi:NAD-dependent SIR2 family protein deacetylase